MTAAGNWPVQKTVGRVFECGGASSKRLNPTNCLRVSGCGFQCRLGDIGVDQPRGYNWFNISLARNEEQKRSRYYDVYMGSCLLQVEQTRRGVELGSWRRVADPCYLGGNADFGFEHSRSRLDSAMRGWVNGTVKQCRPPRK